MVLASSGATIPAGQAWQALAPEAPSVEVPGGHRVHLMLPSFAAKKPGSQGVHVSWPRTLAEPAVQAVQWLEPGAANWPARQTRHEPSFPSVPAGQATQAESDEPRELPDAHGWQPLTSPSARVVPLVQGLQKLEPPRGLHVLMPQLMHAEAPPGAYMPAAHPVHSAVAAALTRPGAQSVQWVVPVAGAWVPGKHAAHAMVPFSDAWKPNGQSTQANPLAENLPVGQAMQLSTLFSEGAVPGAHWTQLASPRARVSSYALHWWHVPLAKNWPPTQALQLPAPGPEKVPAVQFWHVANVRFEYLPATQDTHSVWMELGTRPAGHGAVLQYAAPTAPMTWPMAQGWQSTCPSEREVPATHGEHCPAAASLQWPSAHGTHRALPITE